MGIKCIKRNIDLFWYVHLFLIAELEQVWSESDKKPCLNCIASWLQEKEQKKTIKIYNTDQILC